MVALFVAVSGLIAACAGSTRPSAFAVPSAAYDLLITSGGSPSTKARLANATERLISQCMRAQGQPYYPELTPTGKPQATSLLIPELPPYGSLESRERTGYGLYTHAVQRAAARHGSTTPSTTRSTMTEEQYVDTLSAPAENKYFTLLYGPATQGLKVTLPGGSFVDIRSGGCRATAVSLLYGSVAHYAFAFEGAPLLSIQFIDRIKASPAFQTGLRSWSTCMRADGEHYTDPNAAYHSLATQYAAHGPLASLHQRELRVATDDFTCTHRTKLLQTIRALQDRPMRWLTKLELGQLLTITQIDQTALTRASKLRP